VDLGRATLPADCENRAWQSRYSGVANFPLWFILTMRAAFLHFFAFARNHADFHGCGYATFLAHFLFLTCISSTWIAVDGVARGDHTINERSERGNVRQGPGGPC
jgi:hypothetical protein